MFGCAAGAASLASVDQGDAWVAVSILGIIGSVLALTALTLSIPGIVAGFGLLKRKPRGGPRNSDSLLRWDPDQGEGVWHATEETELPC